MSNYSKDENDNIFSLNDYLSLNNSDDKYRKLFFSMDFSMKRLHENGYFVKDFSLSSILVYSDGNNMSINYNFVGRGCSDDLKRQNILYLSCLAIGVYSSCLKYMNPKKLDFLVDNFDEFAQFIPNEDVPYYKGIILRGASVYYSDFVRAKKEQELKNLQSVSDGYSSNLNNGIKLTKSTEVGRMNASDDKNQSAFITVLLFPIIIFMLGIMISFMLSIYA